MNTNKFSFNRFANFLRWFATASFKDTLMMTAIVAAVAIASGLLLTWTHFDTDGRIFALILFVAGGVVSSLCLSSIDKQTVRQQFISIPATHFEKFLAVIALTAIRLIVVCGIIVAADGIWAQPPNCTTLLEPLTLLAYLTFNILGGMAIRKFPYLYGLIIGGGFSFAMVRAIKALLGDGAKLSLLDNSVGLIIIVTILIMAAMVGSYYCFKKIKFSTIFYQHDNQL